MKNIQIDIESENGHTEWMGASDEALGMIRTKCGDEGRFCMVDGVYRELGELSVAELERAGTIALVHPSRGG